MKAGIFKGTLAVLTVAMLLMAATSANAVVTTHIGTAVSNHDSWNDVANWDADIPTGAIDVVIPAGTRAEVNSAATPTYTGTLTLEDNATLQIGWGTISENKNALGSAEIAMGDGSNILLRHKLTLDFAPITLAGDASIHLSPSTSAHHSVRNLDAITGIGALTVTGNNNNTLNLNVASPDWSGGFVANANDGWRVEANVSGAFGAGDVTFNARAAGDRGATLQIDAVDVIADTAALFLNGPKDNRRDAKLIMNADDTVSELWIDGAQAFPGTYTGTSGDWIHGLGILTVTTGPDDFPPTLAGSDFVDDVFGGPIYEDLTKVNYTVTFSDDMDESTVTAAVFGNAGDATFDIGAITKTITPPSPNLPSVFAVEVLPSSVGNLQLQVNSGAVLKDIGGNPLDTASAILDDTTITINAGTTPPTTITGTLGGNDSWNEPDNWDNAVPFGPASAIIAAGVAAKADTTPPAYSGGLTMKEGANLVVYGTDAVNAIGSGPITMETGSLINLRTNNGSTYTFADTITLAGDATIKGGQSTSGHHCTRNFDGEISGPGQLTIDGVNNNTFNLNAANTFDGLVAMSAQNQPYRVFAKATGSLGLGDVAFDNKVSLIIDALDVIADDATLTLIGSRSTKPNNNNPGAKLILNFDETIADLWLDGTQVAAGIYDSASQLFDVDGLPLIKGDGILTVTPFSNAYIWEGTGEALWASANWNDGTDGGLMPAANGDMTIDVGGSVVTVADDFTLTTGGPAASVTLGSNAELIVGATKALEVTGPVDVGAEATLTVGGTLTAAEVIGGGTLGGSGTIRADLIATGVVSPGPDAAGNAAAVLTIDGSGELGETAEYVCELDGLSNDKLIFMGQDAFLGGTLTLVPRGVDASQIGTTVTRSIVGVEGEAALLESFATVPPSPDFDAVPADPPSVGHLGLGVFHRGVTYAEVIGGAVTGVDVDLYTAIGGDGNADGNVDGQDIQTLIINFTLPGDPADRDWLKSDTAGGPAGRGDGNVDGQDITGLITNFTGDAGPIEPGTAAAEYNPNTGEFTIMVDGVMNWSLTSDGLFAGSALDALQDILPLGDAANLVSANPNTVGEGLPGASPFGYAEVALGQIVEPGTDAGAFRLTFVSGFGAEPQIGSINVVPEPGTLAMLLASLLAAGLIWRRRGSH